MDRPEWIVPHPVTREVYCACSSNSARGRDGNEGATPANRRAPDPFGHLVRWREDGADPAATRFRWDVFVDAGPAGQGRHDQGRHVRLPGRAVDRRAGHAVGADGRLAANLGKGDFAPLGNNQILAVDPSAGVFKRFLTGPRGCEITASTRRPTTARPSSTSSTPARCRAIARIPTHPRALSNWPDYRPDGRPRSATVVIRRRDGGVIGT